MSTHVSSTDLLAYGQKQAQTANKTSVLPIPGTDKHFEMVMPPRKEVKRLYTALSKTIACGQDFDENKVFDIVKEMVYACCPELHDKQLYASLGNPFNKADILEKLFSCAQIDKMGEVAMDFLGVSDLFDGGAKQ